MPHTAVYFDMKSSLTMVKLQLSKQRESIYPVCLAACTVHKYIFSSCMRKVYPIIFSKSIGKAVSFR